MGLKKPDNIPKLSKKLDENEIKQLVNSIDPLCRRKINPGTLQFLSQTEPYYPVVRVQDKCLLIAVNSKSYLGLIWLSGWFEINSAYRDSNNVYRVRLSINDRPVEVDYDTLYPKDITKLSKYGLIINIDYAESLSKYIFKAVAKLDVEEQVNGMGFFMQEGELLFRAYDAEPQILQYTQDTTLDKYIDGLNNLLTNPAIMFALCCSCASLFLAFLSIACGLPLMSFIISFYGKSTTGKSTAQTLMSSVYTDPKDKKIYIPFFGTLNAIIKNFSNKFGVPQLFDEATVSSGLNMESLLYTITLEQDKSRCNSNADLRIPDTWKLIAITSSESKLLSDNQMHNKGLDARLLSFELKFTDDREHSDNIHDFCSKQYGILGKTLSEYLLTVDRGELLQNYEECRDDMRNAIDDVTSFDLAERLVNEYAVILLAGKELIKLGVNIDIDSIVTIMTDSCNELRARTNIAEKYYQHLVNYFVMHPYAEGIKRIEETNSVAFIDELFLKVLSDYGASNPDLVIKELDAAGYLFRRKKNALKNRRRFGNSILANCYEMILPSDGSGSDDDCMTLEYILTHYEGVDEG
ncbi:MAG: DUF927 domain-containing protein [Ruminococcus sp.]|nr:DUF927 domain-containing protein [Ruminococcus sp.]